ncbi:uncharacterized protein LOC133346514 [Lethenteron reissneri]|uniref:uncharacterized protein LOC133346514 n=1 Tax=Lethenteron reissneri TaxID=7753 RepID=UPI002AB6A340|nr:uncharacterized protein LOC133346514 [Lethenteron reissneri]
MAQDPQHSEFDTPTHNTDTEWTSEEEMESMEKQYREFVLKRTGRTASQQTEQRDIWEGSHTEDVKAHRRKLLKDVMKCGKAKRDVKIAEIARVDSYLLAQTDRERLWNEEKFERERQEKLSLMVQVERLHALVREKESALNAPVKHPDVDIQNTYGSNNLPHSEPRGRSPGPDLTTSMATMQSNFDKVTPSQIEEREEEIIIQTGKHEADHPNVRERQIINPKSSGYTVMIERKRAELVQDGKHDINSTPGRRTLRKYGRHDADDKDSSPEKRTSHKHDQHDTGNRSSPERRTSHKHEPWDKQKSPSQVDPRNRCKRHYKSYVKQSHRDGDGSSDTDSSDDDQYDMGNRESSPEGRMTCKNHPCKTTRTTDDRDRNPDNHEARDKHKCNTSPSRHHTRSRQHEGQGQKHSPHRHRSRRSRTPTHKHESQDPHKENKRHKQRDRYESSDRGRSRHRHGTHDNSDSGDKGSSREHSSGTDTTDDEQHTLNSKTLKLMDKALVRIPYFDPHNKNRDIHTHIATVEQEAKIRGLGKSAEKACLLSRSLHEPARPWVASLPNRVKSDFKQLSLTVIRKFGEYSTLTEGFYAVKSMTQGMDQDPRDYLVQFKRAYYAGDVNQYHEGDKMFKIMFFESLSPEITERVRMVLNPETASLRRIESKAYMAWLYRAKNHNSDPEHRERDKEPSLSERNKNHRAVPPCREQQKRTHTWQNNPERGWHENESGTKPNIQENRRRERFRTEPYQHPMPRHTQGSNYAQRWQDNHLAGRCYTDRGGMDANIQENRRMGGQTQSIQFRPIPPPAIPGGNRGITQNAVQIHDKQPTVSASERPTRAPPAEVLNPELNVKYRQAASDRAGKHVDSDT